MTDIIKEAIDNPTSKDSSSYKSIFKATSLFGGVQVYTILMQVIKSKVIAVLLGPLGVGIQGLYQSALDLIKQATSLGISQSAVRDVAEANGSGDIKRINRTVTVLRIIVWFTGLLGLVAVIAFSPLLSDASFGSREYVISFVVLSVILLFDQISAGQRVVLQGMRRLRDLAKATAIGVTSSLFFSLPLYYFFGVKGIVPAMVLTSAVTLLVSWFYSSRVPIEKVAVSTNDILSEGKNMMVMGVSMSLSGVMSVGAAYLIRSLLRKWGSVDEVGLFQAGFMIINSYVGLVFNAIATDYYPRLAAVNKDNDRCQDVVCKQGEISVFLLAPLLSLCILLMPLVIRILYTEQFLPADNFIKWACLGMMFRLASWLVSYIFVAKAESKLFIINEFVSTINYLWMSLLGYKLGGLSGMGIAFALNYFIYFWQVLIISRFRYQFRFTKRFLYSFVSHFIVLSACLMCVLLFSGWLKYATGSIFVILSIYLGFRGLNQRIGLRTLIFSKLHK